MKKNVFCWNGLTMRKQDACEVYQEMGDEEGICEDFMSDNY